MSGNYSFHDMPVDLSLSGSQVSPTRRSKPSSARSTSSRNSSSSRSNQNVHNKSTRLTSHKTTKSSSHSTKKHQVVKEPFQPQLAMSFPTKAKEQPKQTNLIEPHDLLDSIFQQSSLRTKSKSKAKLKHDNSFKEKKSKHYEERFFSIPYSARSDCSDGQFSSKSSMMDFSHRETEDLSLSMLSRHSGSGDADVNYLKSYLNNMNKYKDTPESPTQSIVESNKDDSSDRGSSIASPKAPITISARAESTSPLLFRTESTNSLLEGHVEEIRRKTSARKIQVWYRRHFARRKRNEAVMKRMLTQKKEELETNFMRESLNLSQRSEEEKKKQREQRAREARKQAIKELQEKREAEKERARKIAEEEVERVKRKIETKSTMRSRTSSRASSVSGKKQKNLQNKNEDAVEAIFSSSRSNTEPEASVAPKSSEPPTHTDGESYTEIDGSIAPKDTLPSRTTLDDVLETIKQLEEEPVQLEKPKSGLDDKLAWIEDLQTELQSNFSKASEKTHSTIVAPTPDPNSLLTEAKLHSINSYLDHVEKTESVTLIEEKDSTQQIMQAEQAATEVTTEMLKLKLNLEEKTRSVKLLQDALVQHRELNARQAKEQDLEFNHRFKIQKDQYEATIQRHLTFIDQLIDDKKALNEKCERLVVEMKQIDGKYQKKIKELNENHQTEVKKNKDILVAAEKLRREKWIDEKTKKIKEMTVKGLEPEIQRLIGKHKEEMKKVKAIHEAELLRSDERAGQRYIRQTEELREQLEREKEAACAREREMARQRYEKQMEQEEIALQQQRKRLFAEVAEEKERMSQQASRQRNELEHLKEQIEGNSRIAASTLRDEFEKSMEDALKRHKEEMKSLNDRLEIEKQAWQENYMKKQESFMMQKERELKEAVRRDRDSEIESAILRLEDDMHQQREELDKTTENRIKRIRDKYESEMREVERSEKQTQEKYNAMKAEFNEIESENLRLQSLCKQKDQEVIDTNKIKKKLVEERGNVSDVIRQEFADRLVITDEENKRMKTELSEMRARQRLELERINHEKEEELGEVHKRVRQAIIKKEETISQIRQQYEGAVKRADHLESLLEQQRKKIVGRKKNTDK